MIELFYYPGNANLAPHFILEEMGVPYKLRLLDREKNEHKGEAYLKINPSGRVPAARDGDLSIFETAAICLHICDKYPDKGLAPKFGTPERSKFYSWLMYLTNTVQTEAIMWWYSERYTTDPAGVPAVKAAAEQRLAEMFALLDKEIAKQGPYFLGKDFSALDCYLLMVARFARQTSKPPRDLPHLSKYFENLLKRPAILRAFEQEGLKAPFV